MGKASRNKRQTAQQKIAAQREAARRAERRRRILLTSGSVLGVVVIVVAFILVKTLGGSSSASDKSTPTTGVALPASVSRAVTTVPAGTLDAVGAGSVPSYSSTPVLPGSGAALTAQGKPEMLYIGAEFCPYCAAMRWSMAVALSRFGTLSPARGIHSSSSDVFPNTATLTFYKSSYTSKYLTFTPVENQTVTHAQLQKVTPAQLALWQKFDSSPQGLGYPFIDFGNKYIIKAPIYDPGVLKGLSWSQIATDMQNPSSPVARGVDGAANYITAAICGITKNQPASVCTSHAVVTLAGKI